MRLLSILASLGMIPHQIAAGAYLGWDRQGRPCAGKTNGRFKEALRPGCRMSLPESEIAVKQFSF